MNYTTLKAELKRDEGERYKAYDDATGKELKPGDKLVGNLTLGTGRNLTGVGISDSENDFLLMSDIGRAEGELDKNCPWWRQLDEVRARVILQMCFNMGITRLLGFVNTLAAIKGGNWNAAADGMLASKWATQVGDRAKRLAAMMRSGK